MPPSRLMSADMSPASHAAKKASMSEPSMPPSTLKSAGQTTSSVAAAEVAEPQGLEITHVYSPASSVVVSAIISRPLVALVIRPSSTSAVPSRCHWNAVVSTDAFTLKPANSPPNTVRLVGCWMKYGGSGWEYRAID